jgi:hypothetical protein
MKFDLEKFREMITLANDPGYAISMHEITDTIIMARKALDRMAELEGHLAESEARSLLNFQRYEALRDAIESGKLEWERWTERPSWDDLPDEEKAIRIDFARRGLQAEGKL